MKQTEGLGVAATLGHDDVAQAGLQMAENLAGLAPWLREWGFVPALDCTSDIAGQEPDASAVTLRLDVSRYRVPSVETLLVNADRVHTARQALLDTGSLSAKDLAGVRRCSLNTAHKQIQRACKRDDLVTVAVSGEVRVPAVLLDEALDVRTVWQPVIAKLREARLGDWAIWGWIARPNAGLSGQIASEVIEANPERVYAAAHRRMVQATS